MKLSRAMGSLTATGLLLLYLASTALAAQPANDNFIDAQILPPGTGTPIEVPGSNIEATKEVSEPLGPFAAGHSVWFEWEATSTGFVTIGSCDSDFTAILGVFTGTTVSSLTKVASGNASEGPHCPFREREFTFRAMNGVSYKIAVDGNAFFFPGGPAPDTEGGFKLRIEATPPPANDDFPDATTLTGKTTEEPGGNRFSFASAFGFNWNASKETGEPDHGGDQGGASVWYSWVAPDTGNARVSVCCGSPALLGIYVGNAVDALAPVEKGAEPGTVQVIAGQTYRFAVDGKFDAGESTAEMGSFSIYASMPLAPLALKTSLGPTAILPSPPAIPETTILKQTVKPRKHVATFAFASSEPGEKFRCKLDGKAFSACTSPMTYRRLTPGRHKFAVVAVSASGAEDLTPALTRFTLPRKTSHKN